MKSANKEVFIIIRVTKSEKLNLVKRAGKNLSKFIRDILGLE